MLSLKGVVKESQRPSLGDSAPEFGIRLNPAYCLKIFAHLINPSGELNNKTLEQKPKKRNLILDYSILIRKFEMFVGNQLKFCDIRPLFRYRGWVT